MNNVERILHEADFEDYLKKHQLALYYLLEEKTADFTQDGHASIPLKDAEELTLSLIYVLQIAFYHHEQFKEQSLKDNYLAGQKLIAIKQKELAKKYYKIMKLKIETQNITYNTTLFEGISAFFTHYNSNLFAKNNYITYDYQLFLDINFEFTGIEKMGKYLMGLYCEHVFCSYFSLNHIDELSLPIYPDYVNLILNIYEFVLITAIVSSLLQKNIQKLDITEADIKRLEEQFKDIEKSQFKMLITEHLEQIIWQFHIDDIAVQTYLMQSIASNRSNNL